MGGQGFRERRWRVVAGGHGRVDLAVETNGAEQMPVIIEIMETSWDTIPAERVRPNLRRHLRQLQGYLNTAAEGCRGQWPGGIAGVGAI